MVFSKTILLVEDSYSDIELTKRALSKADIVTNLVVLEDGQEALDYLFSNGRYSSVSVPKPALILLDINIPIVNGLEVLKHIKENEMTKRLPVIILTSSKEESDLVNSYNLGANSYIQKPVDFQQFIETVKYLSSYWLILNESPPIG